MSIEITFIAENREDLIAQISDYMDPYRGMAIDVDRGAGTPVKASPRASFATPEPVEDAFDEPDFQQQLDRGDYDMTPEEEAKDRAQADVSAKGLLELKAKMLTTLQKGIAEGKIDQLRALLASHGGGAKSFPEVDAKLFVGIEKALQNGALA